MDPPAVGPTIRSRLVTKPNKPEATHRASTAGVGLAGA